MQRMCAPWAVVCVKGLVPVCLCLQACAIYKCTLVRILKCDACMTENLLPR